jgi:endonuclease/exonuclease/phosphatase (EEP) superfamily protein YafD
MILGLLRGLAALLILVTALPAGLALLGFAVPLLDLLNHLQLLLFFGTLAAALAALLLGLARGWKILALLGFLASAATFAPEWLSSLAPRDAASGVTTVRLMTHNIFGLNYDMERTAAAIFAEDPDIVALQEYFPEQERLGRLLAERYPHSIRCRGGKRANLGLYSKLPFNLEMAPADCPENAQGSQRTAHITAGFTLADGTSFTVMTTHMDWPYPVERQHEQFAAAVEAVHALTGPLLLVGDFNSTPWSYALRNFERDSGLTRETRNLVTYPELFTLRRGLVSLEPFLPLDHVFQRGLSVSSVHAGTRTGSDHLPVVVEFHITR